MMAMSKTTDSMSLFEKIRGWFGSGRVLCVAFDCSPLSFAEAGFFLLVR